MSKAENLTHILRARRPLIGFACAQTIPGAAAAVLIDLPIAADELSVRFFAGELERLAGTLGAWGGQELTPERTRRGIDEYNALAGLLKTLAERAENRTLADGPARLEAFLEMLEGRPSPWQ